MVQKVQSTELEADRKKSNVDPNETTLTLKERLNEYIKAAPAFIKAYVQVFCIYLGFLSLYWGSIYRRNERYANVKYLVVNQDEGFERNGNIIEPFLGNAMADMLLQNKTIVQLGNFDFVNTTSFLELAASHNNTALEEVERQIHHMKYWGGIYIAPNSTQQIYDSFYTANGTFMTSGAINSTITTVYSTGRHFSALSQYLFRNLDAVGQAWVRFYVAPKVYQPILNQLNSTQKQNLLSSNETVPILTTFPSFSFLDIRPASSPALLGPSEVALIYSLLMSFYAYNFSIEIFAYMRKHVKYRSYLFYKFLISQLNAFLLALVYGLMTLAFRVSTSITFGKSGFLVLWMIIYLYISGLSAVNEFVVSIILAYDKKPLIAPWIIFLIVSQISPTFAPFVLSPGFYRYGYGMPMYNAYEAIKVVFFNTWKGTMGRNIGVLVIWLVVGNVALLFSGHWATKRARRLAREEKLKKKAEREKEKEKEAST
ncbi:SNG1 Nitrosoguanidine resistance protein SNG1 [Candida maltosa Xu316]